MAEIGNNLTAHLVGLRDQYQQFLREASEKTAHYKAQLAHIDALLLDSLLQELSTGENAPSQPPLPAFAPSLAIAEPTLPALAPAPATKATRPRKVKATPESEAKAPHPESAQGKRAPRPLLPTFQGLTRLEAIAKVLQSTPGQDVSTHQVSDALFGKLSAAELKVERKSLNAQLYKGISLKLWEKGIAPGTFRSGEPTTTNGTQPTTSPAKASKESKSKAPAKARVAASEQKLTLALLPAYEGLNKLEAIQKVLTEQSGHALHQDTIFQLLYGDVEPEAIKEESKRFRASLSQGVNKGLWEKGSAPSSYLLKANEASAKPKRSGRKLKEATPQPEPVAEVVETSVPTPAKTPATKAKAARKPAAAKAKKSQKKPRRTEAQMLEALRKVDIQV